MVRFKQMGSTMDRPSQFSYVFMVLVMVAIVALHLATPLLAALFTYLALTCLALKRRGGKWMAIGVFLILLAGIAYGLGYFLNQTVRALPEIAEKAIPSLIASARHHGIELPFTDYDSFKEAALETARNQAHYLSSFAKVARGATTNLLFLVAGCVVAMSLFLNPRFDLARSAQDPGTDLYSRCCEEIGRRFATLYRSFVTVMGAQIIISGADYYFGNQHRPGGHLRAGRGTAISGGHLGGDISLRFAAGGGQSHQQYYRRPGRFYGVAENGARRTDFPDLNP